MYGQYYSPVTKLGQTLRNDRLTASERAGHGARPSQDAGEQAVDDAKSGDERHVSRKLGVVRSFVS